MSGVGSGGLAPLRVLGPVQLAVTGGSVDLGPGKQKCLAAALLLDVGRSVPVDSLIDRLWGDRPPARPRGVLATYVTRLRRVLDRAGATSMAAIRFVDGGYLLDCDPDAVDVHRSRSLAAQARQAAAAGDNLRAVEGLRAALQGWQPGALAGVPGDWAAGMRAGLGRERLGLVVSTAQAELGLGRPERVVGELRELVDTQPANEDLAAELIRALVECGQSVAALRCYQRLREAVADELGAEPSARLRDLHLRVLRGPAGADGAVAPPSVEPVRIIPAQLPPDGYGFAGRAEHLARLDVLLGSAGAEQPTAVATSGTAGVGQPTLAVHCGRPSAPAQLPADVPGFTGRTAELSTLDALLTGGGRRSPDGPGPPLICAVSGTAGVGKTALVVRWAHGVADRFPDGQLYVDLRGYDPGQPVDPADTLAGFLRALGVVAADIPGDRDQRAARYRTELVGRRMLVVLDNAGTVEQVRPLLPGTPTATVVVTSRDALPGFVALHGAHRIELDLLPLADAVTLLRHLLGSARIAAKPQAAAALAARCARLPLALRVAAELAVRRDWPLARLVAELADRQQCLQTLDATGDARSAVTAVFSWSLQHLPADAARLFWLLGLHPGPDLDPHAAAALAGATLGRARAALDTLARAHLIQPTETGRYGLHDLLRAYATRLALGDHRPGEQQSARTRLFDYYCVTTATAMDTWCPDEAYRHPRPAPSAAAVPTFTCGADALAWLDSERSTLVAACADAAAGGFPAHAVDLASTLFRYLDAGGYYTDAAAVHGLAQRAAHRTGDRAGEARALTDLAVVAWRQGRHGPAASHLRRALRLLRRPGGRGPDRAGEARTLYHLGNIYWWHGRYRLAAGRYRQALALCRQTGNRAVEAYALISLGDIRARLGDHDLAAKRYARGLVLFRQAGHRAGEAYALTMLGLVRGRQDRLDAATEHHRQALLLCRRAGDRAGEAYALGGLGDILIRLGQHQQAADQYTQALVLFRRTGDRAGEAEVLNGLGAAILATGDLSRALDQHTAALALATDTGDRYQQARAHDGLGHAHRLLADTRDARRHWQHALTLHTDLGTPEAADIRPRLAALDQT